MAAEYTTDGYEVHDVNVNKPSIKDHLAYMTGNKAHFDDEKFSKPGKHMYRATVKSPTSPWNDLQTWWNGGKLDRANGAAVVGGHKDGNDYETWYKDGKLHRDGGPAITKPDGSQEWYKDGKLHNADGPAAIKSNGTKVWYKDGKRHRDGDEPAIVGADGSRQWYKDGKLHRDNGPAYILPNGEERWYKNGQYQTSPGTRNVNSGGQRY